MSQFRNFLKRLAKDESGAALIEYSLLIGLISAAVIAMVVIASDWVVDAWAALTNVMTANPI